MWKDSGDEGGDVDVSPVKDRGVSFCVCVPAGFFAYGLRGGVPTPLEPPPPAAGLISQMKISPLNHGELCKDGGVRRRPCSFFLPRDHWLILLVCSIMWTIMADPLSSGCATLSVLIHAR